jgi:hypothetical protein
MLKSRHVNPNKVKFQNYQVKCSIRICSSLRRFYFLKGVIWLGLGLGVKFRVRVSFRVSVITPELHMRILHLGRYFYVYQQWVVNCFLM